MKEDKIKLFDDKNNCIEIDKSNYIAEGGEGRIYKYKDKAIKIYKRRPNKSQEQKCLTLISKGIEDSSLCMPLRLLYDEGANFKGFIMPFANGKPLQYTVFGSSRLKKCFPKWTRIELCDLSLKILRIISFLHSRNILIGDINPMNINVDEKGDVYFLDIDSYQVDNYKCMVGTTHFTAPEIQGINFNKILRTKENEYFAIATLLFMIFFPGKSPYACVGGAEPKENILNGNFAYPFGDSATFKAPKGPWEYIWNELPWKIKKTFYLTFVQKAKKHRFSPKNWIDIVEEYRNKLTNQIESKHEIFPVMMGKQRSNVSFGMDGNVKYLNDSNNQIKTVLPISGNTRKIGVIELSTKSVKLLLGDDQLIKEKGFSFKNFPVRNGVLTNTGELLDGENYMNEEGFINRVLPVIKRQLIIARQNKVSELFCVATAAYRAASNRLSILSIIKKELGINVKILSKEEEARSTLVAFVHSRPRIFEQLSPKKVLIDQGGGSTEVTFFNENQILSSYSLNLGTTILMNIILTQTNPNTSIKDGLLLAYNHTKDKLRYYFKNYVLLDKGELECFGVGSAITKGTLVYPNSKQHGYVFTQKELRSNIYLFEDILVKNFKNMGHLTSMLDSRDFIYKKLKTRSVVSIRLGLPLFLEILRELNIDRIIVSATSLWYGVYFENLYNTIENE